MVIHHFWAHRRPTIALATILVLLVAGLLLPLVPTAHAQGSVEMTVTPAFDGNYAPGKWYPLSIVLRNDGPATNVVVAAQLPNGIARNTLPIELPGATTQAMTLYVAMDQQSPSIQVTLEQNGGILVEQQVEVRPRTGERLLGLVASTPLILDLPRRQDLFDLPFLAFDQPLETVPDQALGLNSVTLLLLNDAPTETLSQAQQQAIWGWVANGGHLVIGGGTGAQQTLAGLPGELHAAEIGAPRDLDPAPLADYTEADAPSALPGVVLRPTADALPFGDATAPLWVQRTLGNGRVTQLAFDPGVAEVASWPGATALWDRLLRPPLQINTAFGVDNTPDTVRNQVLTSAIGNLPAVNLPNVTPLFVLLVVYTILIGPGVALMLQRIDRQALAWLVLPLLALVMTAIGIAVAVSSRSDQRIVSQISLIEQIGPDFARARTLVGILTPQDQQFNVTLDPNALVRPLRDVGSAFGQVSGIKSDLPQQRGDFAVPVQAWDTEGFLAEQQVAFPALDAQITFGNTDIQAVVTNNTDRSLRDVVVMYGEQVARIGDLPAGEQGVATWPPVDPNNQRSNQGATLSDIVLGDALNEARGPGGRLDRQLLIREALLNAASGRGSLASEDGPFVLGWLAGSPLPVSVDAPEAAQQQINLLVARPQIASSGNVRIPPGWLRPDLVTDPRATCTAAEGRGITAQPTPVTLTLSLPAAMAGFRADNLTFTLSSDRDWPNAGITTDIYNWDEQRWVEIDYDGPGSLRIPNAAPFLRFGQLRLRLDGRISEAGCLFVEAQAEGELP